MRVVRTRYFSRCGPVRVRREVEWVVVGWEEASWEQSAKKGVVGEGWEGKSVTGEFWKGFRF